MSLCGNLPGFFPNQKPWMTRQVRMLLKAHNTAFRSGDRRLHSAAQANLKRGIKDAKTDYKGMRRRHPLKQQPTADVAGHTEHHQPQRLWCNNWRLITCRWQRSWTASLLALIHHNQSQLHHLSLAQAPAYLKSATVIPVPKKSATDRLNDYRSVALRPVILKCSPPPLELVVLVF